MSNLSLDARTALKCHELLHKTYAPKCFPNLVKDSMPETAKLLATQGLAFESRIVEAIKELHPCWVEIASDLSPDESVQRTLDAIADQSVPRIFQPVLTHSLGLKLSALTESDFSGTIRSGRPDLLLCINRNVGSFGQWIPIDIKSHKALSENKSSSIFTLSLSDINNLKNSTDLILLDGTKSSNRLESRDAIQLAHYHELLTELGLAHPDGWGGIIGSDGLLSLGLLAEQNFGVGKLRKNALELYEQKFGEALAVIQKSVARNENPKLPEVTRPLFVDDAKFCKTCIYRTACISELSSCDGGGDASLLAGVTRTNIEKLPTRSIRLLAAGGPGIPEDVEQKARVYISGIPEVAIGAKLDIPVFDVEIDIDLENSQANNLEEDLSPARLYLYGYIKLDRDNTSEWKSAEVGSFADYSNTGEGEHQVFLQMWNYLQEQLGAAVSGGKTIGIFHYSNHEIAWWRKWVENFADLPGTPTMREMDEFLGRYFIDLRKFAEKVIFPPKKKPVCDYSIKTLAPFADFYWRMDDAGGAMSIFKYEEAIGLDKDSAIAAQNWLREYNEDDVKATMALRHWLSKFFAN